MSGKLFASVSSISDAKLAEIDAVADWQNLQQYSGWESRLYEYLHLHGCIAAPAGFEKLTPENRAKISALWHGYMCPRCGEVAWSVGTGPSRAAENCNCAR
ncbi:MAG TPA: hypothetical protein VII92_02575 [Anaerolineae bacterium]